MSISPKVSFFFFFLKKNTGRTVAFKLLLHVFLSHERLQIIALYTDLVNAT